MEERDFGKGTYIRSGTLAHIPSMSQAGDPSVVPEVNKLLIQCLRVYERMDPGMMTGTLQRQSNQDPEFGTSQALSEAREFRNFDSAVAYMKNGVGDDGMWNKSHLSVQRAREAVGTVWVPGELTCLDLSCCDKLPGLT